MRNTENWAFDIAETFKIFKNHQYSYIIGGIFDDVSRVSRRTGLNAAYLIEECFTMQLMIEILQDFLKIVKKCLSGTTAVATYSLMSGWHRYSFENTEVRFVHSNPFHVLLPTDTLWWFKASMTNVLRIEKLIRYRPFYKFCRVLTNLEMTYFQILWITFI